MSTTELITALQELSVTERAKIFEAVLVPLTSDQKAAINLLPEYMPGGALYMEDENPIDFIEPDMYLSQGSINEAR